MSRWNRDILLMLRCATVCSLYSARSPLCSLLDSHLTWFVHIQLWDFPVTWWEDGAISMSVNTKGFFFLLKAPSMLIFLLFPADYFGFPSHKWMFQSWKILISISSYVYLFTSFLLSVGLIVWSSFLWCIIILHYIIMQYELWARPYITNEATLVLTTADGSGSHWVNILFY